VEEKGDGREQLRDRGFERWLTEELLPFAITVGCSPQEFWYEDANLLWAYRKSYLSRLETESKVRAQEILDTAWITGMYVREAIVSAFNEKAKYPDKPKTIAEQEDDAKAEERQKALDKARDENIKIRAIQIKAMLDRGMKATVPASRAMIG
jgi:hypothetical protein